MNPWRSPAPAASLAPKKGPSERYRAGRQHYRDYWRQGLPTGVGQFLSGVCSRLRRRLARAVCSVRVFQPLTGLACAAARGWKD